MRYRGRHTGSPPFSWRKDRPCTTANRTGFTLIELLVVVGLIALLLAILLPSLQLARSHAQAVVCLSHLRQWGTTFALYTQENEGRLPPIPSEALWLIRGVQAKQGDANEPRVARSIHTRGIACCPRATRLSETPFSNVELTGRVRITVTKGDALAAWEITDPGPPFRGSYGLNLGLFRDPPGGYQPSVSMNVLGIDTLIYQGGVEDSGDSRFPKSIRLPGLERDAHSGWLPREFWNAFLHETPWHVCQRPLSRLVGATDRLERTMGVAMVSEIRYGRSLDQGRRRAAGKMAQMVARL